MNQKNTTKKHQLNVCEVVFITAFRTVLELEFPFEANVQIPAADLMLNTA